MKVLVDTPIWSLALRRRTGEGNASIRTELADLVADSRVAIIGPIRQELLSGVKEREQFDRLRDHLRAFSDTEITVEDHEEAASLFNRCRAKGIQGSNTDFLICATALRNGFSIFTTDGNFAHFSALLPIVLHSLL